MGKEIGLMSVNSLLGKHFFIPSYQRGYRWESQQVRDLLNDIWEFSNKSNKTVDEFYCLQPIVVKKLNEDTVLANNLQTGNGIEWYEVVDGQQRLTTIRLLIHYFNEMWVGEKKREEFDIRYETRENSSWLLSSMQIGSDGTEESSETVSQCIDFYFISEAYKAIDLWVADKTKEDARPGLDKNKLQSNFLQNTKVIWYELEKSEDAIESFTRLNVGKIPLTNAELIKALFLQKRNFSCTESELRQIEIAKEWDAMEHALQKGDFWAFLNEKLCDSPSRIEFLFKLFYEVEKGSINEADQKYGTDQYATFRFFNEKFSNEEGLDEGVKEIWERVKEYFRALEDWFNNNKWYHYIGYLIWANVSVVEIYNAYKGSSKKQFEKVLEEKIKKMIGQFRYTKDENGDCFLHVSYDDGAQKLRSILLLYNIEFILQKKSYDYYRFPFNLFKKEKWDIEHIASQTANNLLREDEQSAWLETALKALEDDERKRYEDDLRSKSDDFEIKRRCITELVGEDAINEDLKNSIGNLTLLNVSVNRSYHNSIFPAKRKIIIEKDKTGLFIPLCTKNVFLKYLTGGNNLRWTEEDVKKTMNDVVSILEKYLKKP